ncbi:hypothetical protein RHSIM_Rhsim01G0025000 [Rhododendron simsii]|uniref:Pentatricopeptide repeat-containing protein n=1 Tax=Rhododendron simsii TaxID=118357 RepID=A0A834HI26_RHOSS|nr:hypothetical protein RHSIM_Rhsim01G0025000 [Rhododendron simsii]
MASLKFSVSLESKNPNFAIGSSQLLGQCSISAFTGGYVRDFYQRNDSDYSKEQQSKPIVVDEESISGVDADKVGALSTEHCNSILKKLERTNDDCKALKFFEWMRRKGKLKQNVAVFNTLIYACSKQRHVGLGAKWFRMMLENGVRPNQATFGKLEEAELVLVSMQEAGFSPNIVVYNMLITRYGKVSKMEDAHRLFHNLRAIQIEPDEATYRSMIEGWGRANNYKEAQWYYKELKREGFRPNSSNMYRMINLQGKNGDEGGALTTLEDMITMGCQYSSMLGILLQAYERFERFDKVPQVLRGSFYEHVLCDQTLCSILAEAYVKHFLVDDAVKILQNKKWKGRGFEDNLYHLLICSCKDLGHFENAIKIYTRMPKSDEKLNLHIICTMIDIYSVMKRFKEAENIYVNLKSSGIALDLITFSVVVRMYIKAGNLKGACLVLEMINKQKNIVPDIYLICDMLRVYQKCGMLDNLRVLYYKLLKSEITWDQEMYKCVINCCALALPIDELSRLFDEMLDRGFDPDTITFNIVLHVYGRSKLFKNARKVLWMARKRGVVDVISYNTLIAVYGQNKYLGNMASIAKEMQVDGFSVSLVAYNSMLDAYGKEGEMEKFRSVLQRLRESGCASDHYRYNIMINIYGEQGWIEEVAEVLMELKESSIEPSLCSYNMLIKAYGIAGMVEDALGLVKEMGKNGIEPDTRTYSNILTIVMRQFTDVVEDLAPGGSSASEPEAGLRLRGHYIAWIACQMVYWALFRIPGSVDPQ